MTLYFAGQEVTDQWYSEVKMHQFGGEPRTLGTGKVCRHLLAQLDLDEVQIRLLEESDIDR